jgi:hypothetical protein
MGTGEGEMLCHLTDEDMEKLDGLAKVMVGSTFERQAHLWNILPLYIQRWISVVSLHIS